MAAGGKPVAGVAGAGHTRRSAFGCAVLGGRWPGGAFRAVVGRRGERSPWVIPSEEVARVQRLCPGLDLVLSYRSGPVLSRT